MSEPHETRILPSVPEPVLTAAERAALSAVYRDPAFWEWFERQPEPPDEPPPAEHEQGHRQ